MKVIVLVLFAIISVSSAAAQDAPRALVRQSVPVPTAAASRMDYRYCATMVLGYEASQAIATTSDQIMAVVANWPTETTLTCANNAKAEVKSGAFGSNPTYAIVRPDGKKLDVYGSADDRLDPRTSGEHVGYSGCDWNKSLQEFLALARTCHR